MIKLKKAKTYDLHILKYFKTNSKDKGTELVYEQVDGEMLRTVMKVNDVNGNFDASTDTNSDLKWIGNLIYEIQCKMGD